MPVIGNRAAPLSKPSRKAVCLERTVERFVYWNKAKLPGANKYSVLQKKIRTVMFRINACGGVGWHA